MDDHAKYLKNPATSQGQAASYGPSTSHGARQVTYGNTEVIRYTQKVIQLPYTMQPPFRISPTKPELKPKP